MNKSKTEYERIIEKMREEFPNDFEKRLGAAIKQSTEEEKDKSIGICVLGSLKNHPEQENMLISVSGFGIESLFALMMTNKIKEESEEK